MLGVRQYYKYLIYLFLLNCLHEQKVIGVNYMTFVS